MLGFPLAETPGPVQSLIPCHLGQAKQGLGNFLQIHALFECNVHVEGPYKRFHCLDSVKGCRNFLSQPTWLHKLHFDRGAL